MCDELTVPAGGKDRSSPGDLALDTLERTVGSMVRVTCSNRTLAVLECQPDGRWNGTVPVCGADGNGDGNFANMTTILIIVWVLGGILLFALLILLTIIISSRKKPERRPNGPRPTTVFQISGQEGGDNPAFCRSEDSSSRLPALESGTNGTDRLPSYQEAVMGGYIQSPVTNSPDPPYFVRQNAPPSYRTSLLHRTTTETNPLTNVHGASTSTRRGDVSPTVASTSTTLVTRATVHSTPARQPQVPTPRPLPQPNTHSRTDTQENQASHRYVERYPGCFWEEDPPPPYTPGPSNIALYRSPTRNSQNRQGLRRSLPARPRQRQPDFSDAPPAPSSSSASQVNPPSTAIPSAPSATPRAGHSQNSVSIPSSQPLNATAASSQMPYVIPSTDSTVCHYSTMNVHHRGGAHPHQGDFRQHAPPLNPSMFANRTTTLHQYQVPLPTSHHSHGHNRSQSHGNPLPVPLPPPSTSMHQSNQPPTSSPMQHCQPRSRHDRQAPAPIARLEVEYF